MICPGKQTGYILLPVIVVITLVAAIALLMNTESALESNITASELDSQQVRYVAEAGLNHALWTAQQQGCGPYSNLVDEPLGNDKYTTALTTDLGSTTAFTISVDQDSWIRSDQPTINQSVDVKLHTRNEILGTEHSLLRYDLSPITAKASILSATAWFYITNAHAAGPIDIHLTSADWIETDATWDSMSTNMDSSVLATIPSQSANSTWIQVNLTSQVQAWVNGQPNFGITLNAPVDGVHGQYNSRESANPPYLEVVVGTPPTSPALLKAIGALGNGVTREITRNDAVLYQHPPGMLHLQPNATDGEDAEIWGQSPNNNYGSAAETWVSSKTNDTTRSLLRFNLGGIPAGARILQADLSLQRQSGSVSGKPVSAHRILNSWDEASVTWNSREAGINWGSVGSDFDNTAVATTLVGPVNQRYAWDITALAQGWVKGSYPNHGVVLVGAIANMAGERFYTSDDADPSRWPSLSITYACACGEICVVPQGSGKIVMIGNYTGFTPDPRDLEKEAIIESWGYEVDQADDNFIWLINFNNYDVVYVSETASDAAISGQLDYRSIGIVNEQGEINDDLGFASGNAATTGNSVEITNNDHYISMPFALGSLPIYDAEMEIIHASGSKATGMQTLAEVGTAESLMTLDIGATTIAGPAVGRRVSLPLGRATDSSFNWGYLNNNGRLLVLRSIEWASGGGNLPAVGSVLLVVNDDANLTAQENAKKSLIESWNYTVKIIDSGDSQAAFDAAVAVNDVVFITEDINSNDVGTKLVNAAIGVVTEEANLSDEFGMAASIAWESGTEVEINNNSHYITSPFSLGLLPIFTANESLAYVTGTQSPDLGKLASSSSGYGVVTLGAGAALFGGGSSVGRRAQLPWGGNDFDVNHLNADGLTILLRAIEWAGGAGCESTMPLLMLAADANNPTAEENTRKTLLQSWCYGVSLVTATEPQATYDTFADDYEVVYVPSSVPWADVSGKLKLQPVGVVNEIGTLSAYLGFTSGSSGYTGTVTELADNSHYITTGLPLGNLALTTTATSMRHFTNTMGPGFKTLSVRPTQTNPMIMTLDTGDELLWGGNAPERRVMLPWGGSSTFDVNNLTVDGETILRRSLEWAVGPVVSMGPIAHWKLDETSGNTAIDSEGGHDGTWTNNPAPGSGVINGGLVFDGTDDYVDLTSDAELDDVFLGGATVIAWVYAESWGENNYARILDKSSELGGDRDGWMIGLYGNKQAISLAQGFTGERGFWRPQDGTFPLNEWVHVAFAYDASSTANDPVIYQNGVPQSSLVEISPSGTIRSDASISLRMGNHAEDTSRTFDGTLDDIRIYDRMLSSSEVADLYAASAPVSAATYTELNQSWSATSDNSWQTFDLSLFVPANAVAEVAIVNAKTDKERWGGLRALGSSLDRRFRLHEAESGGVDAVTMHVQVDGSSQIQHFAEKKNEVSFILLGYWTGASYVELFDSFSATEDGGWNSHNFGNEGVVTNGVAEIVLVNTSSSRESLAGLRTTGSSIQRHFSLHEAEKGGVDTVSMFVQTDASAGAEVYAPDEDDLDVYVVGYWSTPPGTYTETGGVNGQVSLSGTWQTGSLTSFGIPAYAIAQFVMSNERDGNENQMGLRETGSSISRRLDLQEAEAGGGDLGTMHVRVDASAEIQWAAEYGAAEGFFYPVGWWVLSP